MTTSNIFDHKTQGHHHVMSHTQAYIVIIVIVLNLNYIHKLDRVQGKSLLWCPVNSLLLHEALLAIRPSHLTTRAKSLQHQPIEPLGFQVLACKGANHVGLGFKQYVVIEQISC